MANIAKTGYLRKHSKSFLEGGWKNVWVVLHKDSYMLVYKKQGDSTPKAKIFVKEVCKWFAVGQYTDGMADRPPIPSDTRIDWMISIPQKPSSKSKIHWFLANSESEFHEWMGAICSTLPPPPQHSSSKPHSQPIPPPASAPPPYQPGPIKPATGAPPLSSQPPYPSNPGMPQPGPVGYQGMPMPSGPVGYAPPPGGVPYQQPYPQQPYAPPPGQYPQQAYYPAPGAYQPPPQNYGYQQQPYQQPAYVQGGQPYQPAPHGYAQQPNVVYVQQGGQKPHKKGGLGGMLGGNTGRIAAGALGGAALGYGASRMMGGGFGMFGMGPRWGSWSSLSSCGSFGSYGSCGSFGSF